MRLPKYEMEADDSLEVFEFVSIGPKGSIYKIIKFSETTLAGFYNLAFGDKDLLIGELNDEIISNNSDSEKVLATIVSAVDAFTYKNSRCWVYATGSTPARTRLYRIGMSKYLSEAQADFEIFGLLNGEWEEYQLNTDYTAFVVRRRVW